MSLCGRMRQPVELVGVISDTHGLLRPEVPQLFKGVSLILHAGDIGSPDVLESLRTIAPVVAVRGNNDTGKWARRIPETRTVHAGAVSIYMLHNLKEMKRTPSAKNLAAVITGHSHRPSIEYRAVGAVYDRPEGVLFLNPGSAGPRRFKLPVSVARLIVQGSALRAELIDLGL
jgi:putative phosphoesterase